RAAIRLDEAQAIILFVIRCRRQLPLEWLRWAQQRFAIETDDSALQVRDAKKMANDIDRIRVRISQVRGRSEKHPLRKEVPQQLRFRRKVNPCLLPIIG